MKKRTGNEAITPAIPADMVRMGVGGDEQVDPLHPHLAQERDDIAPPRVNQRCLPLWRLHEHRVALSHIQEGDAEDGVGSGKAGCRWSHGRDRAGCRRHEGGNRQEGAKQRSPFKAPCQPGASPLSVLARICPRTPRPL